MAYNKLLSIGMKKYKVLTSVGFIVNEASNFVYYWFDDREGMMLCLYMDDILDLGNNVNVIEEVKAFFV
jgi:hypothetical protein